MVWLRSGLALSQPASRLSNSALKNSGRTRRCYSWSTAVSAPSVSMQPSSASLVSRIELVEHKHQKAPCGWRKRIVASYGMPAALPVEQSADEIASEATSTLTSTSKSTEKSALAELGASRQQDGQTQQQRRPLRQQESVSAPPSDNADLLNLQVDMDELQKLASKRCTPLRLTDMYKYAVDVNNPVQRLRNAQFLHKELPIRIAQRAVDLLTLPHGLSDALSVRQVAHVYLRYLQKFQDFPVPTTPEEEERFTDMLQSLVLDRSSIPTAIAHGVADWRHASIDKLDEARYKEMDDALYRFFMARVGLRFLTEHHILSSPARAGTMELNEIGDPHTDGNESNGESEAQLGCIQKDCCPEKETRKLVAQITKRTWDCYGLCPEIEIFHLQNDDEDRPTRFTYVPHHLHYMVGELLQNSCEATVKHYLKRKLRGDEDVELHPIRVVIVKGEEDVTIKIADKGGGIPRSKMATIWRFAHTTSVDDESDDASSSSADFGIANIRGFGLPLARIYARYLGGELTLKSMEGYGLDAYLHLPRLGDSCENLPPRVMASPGDRVSLPKRGKRPMVLSMPRSFSTATSRDEWSQDLSSHLRPMTNADQSRRS